MLFYLIDLAIQAGHLPCRDHKAGDKPLVARCLKLAADSGGWVVNSVETEFHFVLLNRCITANQPKPTKKRTTLNKPIVSSIMIQVIG
jgi:hypothetical protein